MLPPTLGGVKACGYCATQCTFWKSWYMFLISYLRLIVTRLLMHFLIYIFMWGYLVGICVNGWIVWTPWWRSLYFYIDVRVILIMLSIVYGYVRWTWTLVNALWHKLHFGVMLKLWVWTVWIMCLLDVWHSWHVWSLCIDFLLYLTTFLVVL